MLEGQAGVAALPVERERAGNHLVSLSAFSGTGIGFCRYDYQRGHQVVAVVTVPDVNGERGGAQLV